MDYRWLNKGLVKLDLLGLDPRPLSGPHRAATLECREHLGRALSDPNGKLAKISQESPQSFMKGDCEKE
ncbi:hypothetical protein GCM10017635_23330 [Paracoccus kondratievae]|uniref:Uncharacterized protein n=1 Tax=Paracoccus kondratievae TaxID=135740 RepID=A0AAD3RUI7_9RHOB|nr:hypothetical protein GCM10017635_23330 [Paracoccus kondratievae]